MVTKTNTVHRRLVSKWYIRPGEATSVQDTIHHLPRSRTGVTNPTWRSDVKAGRNASTALSATASLLEVKPVNWGISFLQFAGSTTTSYDVTYENLLQGENTPSIISSQELDASLVGQAEAIAIRELYRKIRQVHSQFAGGVFLGELRKTIHMIARPAQALRQQISKYSRSAQSLRKGRPGTTMSLATRKATAGLYLEAVFGWQPLLHDIRDGAVALGRLVIDKTPERFRAFGVKDKLLSVTMRADELVNGYVYVGTTTIVKRTATTVYYGAFRRTTMEQLGQASLQRVIDLSGFNLRDFLPTAWELIPYSFLVDYFTNIGDLLEAAATDTSSVNRLTKVSILETSREVRVKTLPEKNKAYWIHNASRQFISQKNGNGGHVTSYRAITREPTGVPFMVPRFEIPDLFSKQTLNVIGLALAR